MSKPPLEIESSAVLEREHFDMLFDVLARKGYRVVGPTVRDGAIVYDRLGSVKDIPIGWTDEQNGGSYRLKKRSDEAIFGYTVGPDTWKRFLYPPVLRLWSAKRDGHSFKVIDESGELPRFAFVGVRACELHAISIQDKVLIIGQYPDLSYKTRRDNAFYVAVNCAQAGGTCFCVSMNTGPKVTFGFDLALTEVLEDSRHYFVVEIGTERGAAILRELPTTEAGKEMAIAERIWRETAKHIIRSIDTTNLKELLYRNLEHPRWNEVAARCLTCGNCTSVCPTCFCSTVEDVTDLKGAHAERWRKWDSCFTMDFSYIHGGSVRASQSARYRQWMTHKLANWVAQFGTFGCVGCGRCITWCPVGIDITEEARAIQESDSGV